MVEVPRQHLRVTIFPCAAVNRDSEVYGDRRVIEVALEIEASLADEFVVFGIVFRGGRLAEYRQPVNVPQVQVDDAVTFRQQSCRLRRCMAADQNKAATAAVNSTSTTVVNSRRFVRAIIGIRAFPPVSNAHLAGRPSQSIRLKRIIAPPASLGPGVQRLAPRLHTPLSIGVEAH